MANTTTPKPKSRDERIYDNYRAVMRSFPYGSALKSPERRQRARQLTVDRYNVPYAEVKRIVAIFDAINGISHETSIQQERRGKVRYNRLNGVTGS